MPYIQAKMFPPGPGRTFAPAEALSDTQTMPWRPRWLARRGYGHFQQGDFHD